MGNGAAQHRPRTPHVGKKPLQRLAVAPAGSKGINEQHRGPAHGKLVQGLPDPHRNAIRWALRVPDKPLVACRIIGTTHEGPQFVRDGRQMLCNRGVGFSPKIVLTPRQYIGTEQTKWQNQEFQRLRTRQNSPSEHLGQQGFCFPGMTATADRANPSTEPVERVSSDAEKRGPSDMQANLWQLETARRGASGEPAVVRRPKTAKRANQVKTPQTGGDCPARSAR